MHPLVAIALVLATGLLWLVFNVVMLARLNRAARQAQRRDRKANRIKRRPKIPVDVPAGPAGITARHAGTSHLRRRAWHG